MGAGGSKTAPTGPTKHVFSSDVPVQFSQDFVQHLQGSSETDSSRAQSLELHIQHRVNQELERIRSREAQTLADIEKKLEASSAAAPSSSGAESATSPSSKPVSSSSSLSSSSPSPPQLSLESPRIPVAGPGNFRELESSAAAGVPSASPENAADTVRGTTPYHSLSNGSLSSEITAFKERLAKRPAVRELDPAVDRSRHFLVTCLRDHPTRPLKCEQEVEDFRNEIRRLETKWVDKVIA